nr:putative capsid protein [Cressdnaviricota sp.]
MGGYKVSPGWNYGYTVNNTGKLADAVHVGYDMSHNFDNLVSRVQNSLPPPYTGNRKRKAEPSGGGDAKRFKSGQSQPTRFRGKGSRSKTQTQKKKKQKKKMLLRKRRKQMKKKMKWSYGKCISRGMSGVQETTLSCNDADCVYVVAASHSPIPSLIVVIQALIRKLFETHGKVQVTGADSSKWPGFTYNNNAGWAVQLLSVSDITRAISIVKTYVVVNGDSLAEIATEFYEEFRTYVNQYADTAPGAGNPYNALKLYAFNLYMTTTNPVPSGIGNSDTAIYKGQILFEDETVHFGCFNELKLQNRSVSAEGENSTDVVDSNPIQGNVMFFNGLPRGRDAELAVLKRTNEQTGVRTFQSTDFGSARGMREPPDRRIFVNCIKSNKVLIAPGAFQFIKWKYSKSLKLNTFLKNVHLNSDSTIITSAFHGISDIPGKALLIALEDVVNFNSDYEISITFELDRKFGCFLTTLKKKGVIPTWESNLEV